MTTLLEKKCIPCEGGTEPLTSDEATKLLSEVSGWSLDATNKVISKTFTFKDFSEALAATNKVGNLAEEEGHHPDLHLSWGKLKIELSTHAIGGLSENDFILAAKIDALALEK